MIHQHVQGTNVPALGFGTYRLPGQECLEGVSDALAIGYRHIDTAQGYANEEFVGEAIERSGVPRDEIFLVTKVKAGNYRTKDLVSSAEESLRKLRTDYVDLLLLHWPNDEIPLEEPLAGLQELQARGLIRFPGVSNFPSKLVLEASEHLSLFANQVEYHPYLSQKTLLKQAEEFDYLLTAYSPIAKGEVSDDPVLGEIGGKYGKTPAQVALRWLIQQRRVAAIPKAASHKHRLSNFEIFDFELTREEMTQVFGLARNYRITAAEGGPEWDVDE